VLIPVFHQCQCLRYCAHYHVAIEVFTEFIWWVQTYHQVAANPQIKPINLSASRLLRSKPTTTIYYYCSTRMMTFILPFHGWSKAEVNQATCISQQVFWQTQLPVMGLESVTFTLLSGPVFPQQINLPLI